MAEELKLFRTWSSPFALRAVHALKIKGLQYETVFEVLKNFSDTVLDYNPIHKKVPVLVHNGKPICESLVILEYIDETWNQPPLLPKDPYQRAIARFWARFGDDKVLHFLLFCFIEFRLHIPFVVQSAINILTNNSIREKQEITLHCNILLLLHTKFISRSNS